MPSSQRVLFPVDLSSDYPALTPEARRMVDRRDVEIVLLHPMEEPSHAVRGMELARSIARMEFLAQKEFAVTQCTPRVVRGSFAQSIVEYACNFAPDMILLPGNTPASVSREVLAKAPCAVWLDWLAEPASEIRHICCALTLKSSDAMVLCRAAEIAREMEAELTILHAVVPESPMILWWDSDAVTQEVRIAQAMVEELRDRFAPNAQLHVEAGRVDWVISQALHSLNATLLVTAHHDETIGAAAMTCPVLRIAGRKPEMSQESESLAATA